MSFLKRLFGLGAAIDRSEATNVAQETEHKGFLIRAAPRKVGGQFQVAGIIAKEIAGQMREHAFVRADTFGDLDTAVEITLNKARMTIDQQGERIFG